MSNLQDETGSEGYSTADDPRSDTAVPGRRHSVDDAPHARASAQGSEPGEVPTTPDWSQRSKIANGSGREAFTPVHSAMANDAQGTVREDLLDQFYSTLRVTYLSAQKPADDTDEIHQRIRAGLDGERSWRGAYEIEQLLAFIMTKEQLTTEVVRRMNEAEALKLPFVPGLSKQLGEALAVLNDEKQDAETKARSWDTVRYVLHRLLNDLQWFYKQRIRRRDAAMRLSLRVSALFFTALVYFFALLFIQFFAHNPPGVIPPASREPEQSVEGARADGAAPSTSPVVVE